MRRSRARLLALALLAATSAASCRGRRDEERAARAVAPRAAGEAAAPADAPEAPSALVDAEPYRRRAKVPAIAWAAVTRDRTAAGAVGLADVEGSAAATPATPFEAASVAKTVVATAVMQLVEEGRVSLDVDVSAYVGFSIGPRRPGARPITLRHLLTHTSSIVDHGDVSAPATVPLGDFLRRYFADAGPAGFLDAGAGAAMLYSNVGPSLAALAVERVTGTPFAARVRARVFAPLGMRATAFGHASVPGPIAAAAPYSATGSGFLRHGPASHALYPAVDLFAPAQDLARFARAILRGGELDGVRVLRAESVDEMLRVQLDAAPGDALGWQARTLAARRVLGHEGEDVGASTCLYLDRIAGVGAIVLANGDAFQGGDPARVRAIGGLVEELLARAASP